MRRQTSDSQRSWLQDQRARPVEIIIVVVIGADGGGISILVFPAGAHVSSECGRDEGGRWREKAGDAETRWRQAGFPIGQAAD